MRVLIGSFGDPGHTFPAIALGKELAARGHEVLLQSWQRWRTDAEREGMAFAASPEYHVFPTRERPLKPYEAVERATRTTRPLVREFAPDVVVSDILTLAPTLAAELEGVPAATLVPHVFPPPARGLPPFGLGALAPSTAAGRALWRALSLPTRLGLEYGRRELNETRRMLGLAPTDRLYGAMSDRLVIVGSFPQLEYERSWPEHVHVTGPLQWEPPYMDVSPPPGDDPLVVVAPSTSQDTRQSLLSATVRGLRNSPVRVLATFNRRRAPYGLPQAPNTRVVEWLSYERAMSKAALVVCHGGHGTLVRALSLGVPALVVPAAGDMGENGARLQWSGAGLMLPQRLLSGVTVRSAVRRVLGDPRFSDRAGAIGAWSRAHSGPVRAADLVEQRFGPGQATEQSASSATSASG